MCHHRGVDSVTELTAVWGSSPRVAVLTGAGISTDSGISDFRGPQGVWTRNPASQALFHIDSYVNDPGVRRMAWASRREHQAWTAQPNRGHIALTSLQQSGRVATLMTQNIDGLHQRAGSVEVLELHGTIWEVLCLDCARRWPTGEVLARPEDDPRCTECGGILKTATISFGQALDAQVIAAALRATSECDLMVAIGTSLQVYPVAGLAELAPRLAIINAEPTPLDGAAEVVVREPISHVLGQVKRALA
jgi:NAD-dependent deacetylase